MPKKTLQKRVPTSSKVGPIALFPFVFILLIFCFRTASFSLYRQLVSEDGVMETLQFVFYFLTGCISLHAVRLLWNKKDRWNNFLKLGFFVASGVLVFMSFEEISWGERILKYKRIDYFTVYNVQQEMSIHNLNTFQPYLHGIYIAGGLFLAIIIPLLYRMSQLKQWKNLLFGWEMIGYFLPLSIIYYILEFYQPISLTGPNRFGMIWRDQEVVELLLSMGLFIWFLRMKLDGKVI